MKENLKPVHIPEVCTLYPAVLAAKLLDYTQDHLSKMCRKGVIRGFFIGRSWAIPETEIMRIKSKSTTKGANDGECSQNCLDLIG